MIDHPTSVPVPVLIDGVRFPSQKSAYQMAKRLGFSGCRHTFQYRLNKGENTWEQLLVSPNPLAKKRGRKSGAVMSSRRAREKLDMAALFAELDARKAAIERGEK